MKDSNGTKVVSLDEFGRERTGHSPARAGELLRECRTRVADHLGRFVTKMMDQVDDALFARAEKAENNTQQNFYFDAMREVRLKRSEVEARFREAFLEGFTQRIPRRSAGSASDASQSPGLNLNWEDEDGSSDLGLVEQEEVEENLAVTNMAAKIRNNCTTSLYALDQRIGLLLNDPDLEKWENPVGPAAICESFRRACEVIRTGLEVRLVILKLFDQHVVTSIQGLYRELNQYLAAQGVLPEIRARVRLDPNARTRRPGAGATGDPAAPAADAGPAGDGPSGEPMVEVNLPAALAPGAALPTINSLTLLQRGGAALLGGELGDGHWNETGLVAGTVNVIPTLRSAGLVEGLDRAGDMTIDIVAMLFDYILGDENLHDTMRAQIGRLQIPILKIALLDRTFFGRKNHPARRLLNGLAQVALTWNDGLGEADPACRKVKDTVQTMLDEFEDDLSLVERLADDLQGFLTREEEQVAHRVERSTRLAKGRDRLHVAKQSAVEQVQRTTAAGTTELVQGFITRHWKNLLFVTCAQHGKDSEEWKQAVQTMRDLIWSVKPKRTVEERKRLAAMQRGLLDRLRRGMDSLSLPAEEQQSLLSALVKAHGRTATVSRSQRAPTPDEGQLNQLSGAAVEKLAAQQQVPVADLNRPPPRPASGTGSDQAAREAQLLQEGHCVELIGSDGKPQRAKLSWVSPVSGTYLFTDRQGLKITDMDLEGLTQAFRLKRIRRLDAAPLLDRAVPKVLRDWKQQHPQT